MSDIALCVENVSKRFTLGAGSSHTRLSEVISSWGRALNPWTKQGSELSEGPTDFWALKDVSFEVSQGEVVGIIGRNGAGKSTLLKILSRITEPTSGRFGVRGRVGSLLEVGTGFHPELTGRENIFLSGTVLGMKRGEVQKNFDEIVAFADVERFIDTPVKRYSSGMSVRLGFAVAAHLRPEVLIVDEVLAVGDYRFQSKCLEKMNAVAQGGRTVLFVSHNLAAVNSLCTRCCVLQEGRVGFVGSTAEAIASYTMADKTQQQHSASFPDDESKDVCILSIALVSREKGETSYLAMSDSMEVHISYKVRDPIDGVNLTLRIDREGVPLLSSFDCDLVPERLETRQPGSYKAVVTLPTGLFKAGQYAIGVGAGKTCVGEIDRKLNAILFELNEDIDLRFKSYKQSRPGAIICQLPWEITQEQCVEQSKVAK